MIVHRFPFLLQEIYKNKALQGRERIKAVEKTVAFVDCIAKLSPSKNWVMQPWALGKHERSAEVKVTEPD